MFKSYFADSHYSVLTGYHLYIRQCWGWDIYWAVLTDSQPERKSDSNIQLASRPGALCGGSISTTWPAVFFAEGVTVKLKRPRLLCWFYRQTNIHTAIHCIGVHNIMLFTDGCAALSERGSKNWISVCGSQCWYCGGLPQIHYCVGNTDLTSKPTQLQ